MVDLPGDRRPDGIGDGAPARAVRKTRRPAGEASPDGPEPSEVVFADLAHHRAELYWEWLEERGVRAIVRTDFDTRIGSGALPWGAPPQVGYEVLVPPSEVELATALIDGPLGDLMAEYEAEVSSFAPQPDDDYFVLRQRMEIEMPGAGSRAKDRAARRALAELDGRPASERPNREQSQGCRRQMILALCILLALLIGLAVFLLSQGEGLTDPGCPPPMYGQSAPEGC